MRTIIHNASTARCCCGENLDEGVLDNGRQVAFLQQDGALKQVVKGLVAGATYRVEFSENGRQWAYGGTNDAPLLEVRLGTAVVLPAHAVPPSRAIGGVKACPWSPLTPRWSWRS